MNKIPSSTPLGKEEKPSAAETLLYIALKYKTAIIGALVLIVCLGGGTFFWMRQQQASEQEAALQLSRVTPALGVGNYQVAIFGEGKVLGLKKIAAQYSATPSGKMATLLLANAYFSVGEFDSALKVFKTLSIADNDLAAAGLAGTAACYSNKNQFALAAENYQAASAKAENKALKAQYLAHAGESYQQAIELKKASDLFTKVIADYPGSTGAALSQRSLWQISGNL